MLAEASTDFDTFTKQTYRLTIANLKSRYRKTIAGLFWVIFNPIIMFGVQSLIFGKILKIGVPNYYLFLVGGLLPWLFIVQALEMCTPLIQFSGQLLKAFPVHPLVYLSAQLIDNFTNFLIAFCVIFLPLAYYDAGPAARFLLLPLPLITLVGGVLGMAWLLSTAQVFLRDTRFVTTFILNVSFFLTPVFYPLEFVPEEFRWMAALNPFYILIAPIQACLSNFEPEIFWYRLAKAAALAAVLLVTAAVVWRKKRNDIYFHV